MYKKIYLEITNTCNLNCPFCLTKKKEPKFLSLNEFKLVLNKLKNKTNYLYFHVLGEPLMHPLINEFIDLASNDFYINITTNGFLIEKIKYNKNIRQLNISLHSYSKDSNISLNDYLFNIINAIDILKDYTYVSLRLWAHSEYKDEIINYLENYYHVKIKGKQKIINNVFIEFEHIFEWPEISLNKNLKKGTCYALKDHIAILVDGTVVPCCLDGNGIINLGNIFKNNLDNIENSQRFIKMKKGFQNNQKIELLCQNCDFVERFKKMQNKL